MTGTRVKGQNRRGVLDIYVYIYIYVYVYTYGVYMDIHIHVCIYSLRIPQGSLRIPKSGVGKT